MPSKVLHKIFIDFYVKASTDKHAQSNFYLAVVWGPTSQVRVCVVLVSLKMLERDGCTFCATLLEEPFLSTGKIM